MGWETLRDFSPLKLSSWKLTKLLYQSQNIFIETNVFMDFYFLLIDEVSLKKIVLQIANFANFYYNKFNSRLWKND